MNDFTKEELQYMIDNYSNEKKTIYVLEGAADINKIETWAVCRIFQYIDGEY